MMRCLTCKRALQDLPDEQRETVFLKIWSGMKALAEIAEVTATPLNTVASPVPVRAGKAARGIGRSLQQIRNMRMEPYDEVERYLAEFRLLVKSMSLSPLRPNPRLPCLCLARGSAAVAVVVAAAGLLWFAHRKSAGPPPLAVVQPAQVNVVRERPYRKLSGSFHPACIDGQRKAGIAVGHRIAPCACPPCRGDQSTLKVLAKD